MAGGPYFTFQRMNNISRFRTFVQDMTRLVERHGGDEPAMLEQGEKLLRELVTHDDWLPEEFARPRPGDFAPVYRRIGSGQPI